MHAEPRRRESGFPHLTDDIAGPPPHTPGGDRFAFFMGGVLIVIVVLAIALANV